MELIKGILIIKFSNNNFIKQIILLKNLINFCLLNQNLLYLKNLRKKYF